MKMKISLPTTFRPRVGVRKRFQNAAETRSSRAWLDQPLCGFINCREKLVSLSRVEFLSTAGVEAKHFIKCIEDFLQRSGTEVRKLRKNAIISICNRMGPRAIKD